MARKGTIYVDTELFQRKTWRLVQEIGMSKPQFLDQQAGLLFRDVAKFTPPFASGAAPRFKDDNYGLPKDRAAGEGALKGDILRSMRPVAPASRWRSPVIQKAIRSKDTKALAVIFKGAEGSAYHGWSVAMFNRKFHTDHRDTRMRVRTQKQQLVLPKAELNRYIKSALNTVGQGKAAFAWAAMRMGRKQPPKWIARHMFRTGASVQKGEDFRLATGSHGALRHTIPFLPRLEKHRARAAQQRLLYLTKSAIRKAGFRAA